MSMNENVNVNVKTIGKAGVSEKADLLTKRQLNRATLARQMLLERADIPAATAVERLIGMQSQEAKPPFGGLWSRLQRFKRQDLHQALRERELVRATLMRGTIHYFSAADYAAFRMTLQPVLTKGTSVLGDRAAGLDLEKVLAAARELLAERPRTFGEIRSLLLAAFPDVNERALGFVVRMHLPLVMTPTADRWAFPANAEFALAESWLDTPIATDDAIQALTLRYLAAFGPASAMDMQTWSGLPKMKPVLDALRPQLIAFKDERGREHFDLPDAPRPDAETPAPVRFLPEFDNLLLSHADRTRVIADEHRDIVYMKGNLRLQSSFLVDGFVSGTWRVERKRKEATLLLTPFAPQPKRVLAELTAEGEALLRFLEEDATSFAVVETAPH
jgi:hypothetical protein